MYKKVRELTTEVEALAQTLEKTETELGDIGRQIEVKDQEQEQREDLITTFRQELGRCTEQLGDVNASRAAGSSTDDAGEEANEALNTLLAQRKEAQESLKMAEDAEKLANEQCDKLDTDLKSVKARVAELESSADGGQAALEMLEQLRERVAEKVAQLNSIEAATLVAKDDRATMNQELADTQRQRLLLKAQTKNKSKFVELQQRHHELAAQYAIAKKQLQDINEGNVAFGGNEGIQNLAKQLEEVKSALSAEEMLREKQKAKQIEELKAFNEELNRVNEQIAASTATSLGMNSTSQTKTNQEYAKLSREVMEKRMQLKEISGSRGQLDELAMLNKDLSEAQRRSLALQSEIRDLKLTHARLDDELDTVTRAL